MSAPPQLDDLARLLGDRSRATMLGALMDGRQWTGRELAGVAHVTPSTASLHLKRLVEGDIVSAIAHGRHKYYRIGRPEVGRAIEGLMALAAPVLPRHTRAMVPSFRHLRMCYDHLAGVVAVRIAERLGAMGAIALEDESGHVTDAGLAFFTEIGIELDARPKRRPVCKPCLDWSERRYHLAGRVGASIARHARDSGWVVHGSEPRALELTSVGVRALRESFAVNANV